MDTLVTGSKTTKTEKKVLWVSSKRCFGPTTTKMIADCKEEHRAAASAAARQKDVEKERKETTARAEESSALTTVNQEGLTKPVKHTKKVTKPKVSPKVKSHLAMAEEDLANLPAKARRKQ